MPLTTIGYDASFLGKPLIMWGGAVLLLLILFQVLSAKRMPFEKHALIGYLILLVGLGHALIGLALYLP